MHHALSHGEKAAEGRMKWTRQDFCIAAIGWL